MTPDQLVTVGCALYGTYWQAQLSAALDVAPRTMRRWVAGDTRPPSGVVDDLLTIAYNREAQISESIALLKSVQTSRS